MLKYLAQTLRHNESPAKQNNCWSRRQKAELMIR